MDQIELIIRKMGWERNKKTLTVPPRVDEASLKQARDLHAEGKYEAALDFLSEIRECVDDARCLRMAGLCHLGLGHMDEAIELFTLSRETSRTELARDEMNLCMALLSAERFTEAIGAAQRAVELAPSEIGPHINLVSALRRADDSDELERYISNLHENFPEVIQSPLFQDRLKRDPDFMGVAARLEKLNSQKH
jgi:tetratricopeptide (TPR) repeat protein